MVHKILKSLLPTEEMVNSFQRLCNAQIEEMRSYDVHMENVKKDPEKYHVYPHPNVGASPDIIASIVPDGDDYNVEFELFDDTPVPTLEEKKTQLTNELIVEANRLREEILPMRKRAIREIRVGEIPVKEEERSKEQQTFLDSHLQDVDSMNEIYRHCAELQDQIEDLTEGNIDKWKSTPFPEIKK